MFISPEVMKIARMMSDPRIEAAETAIRWRPISQQLCNEDNLNQIGGHIPFFNPKGEEQKSRKMNYQINET